MEEKIKKKLCIPDDKLDTMRLLIEGAVSIYEGDGMRLGLLAQEEHDLKAQIAYESIGSALYELCEMVCAMQVQSKEEDAWLAGFENEE